jgi:hypothetical protein
MQKFKRLRDKPTKAWARLDAVRQLQPSLFAHWHMLPRNLSRHCEGRMTGDYYVRSCESGRVRLPLATHQNRMHGLIVARWGRRLILGGSLVPGRCAEIPPSWPGRDLNLEGSRPNQRPTSPDKAVVLCMDEKSQIQAPDRTQPSLPMK